MGNGGTLTAKLWESTIGAPPAYPTEKAISLRPVNTTIKGFAGSRTSSGIKMGTIRWKVQDDDGREHVWEIPGSYYVPEAGMRLFSPQHWSQTRPPQDRIEGKWARHSVSGTT
ncbi:MAG: hypothetical protein ACRCT2_07680, partial [Plesiomonas shigelloides]